MDKKYITGLLHHRTVTQNKTVCSRKNPVFWYSFLYGLENHIIRNKQFSNKYSIKQITTSHIMVVKHHGIDSVHGSLSNGQMTWMRGDDTRYNLQHLACKQKKKKLKLYTCKINMCRLKMNLFTTFQMIHPHTWLWIQIIWQI